jgi:hypothetical protein
MTLSHGSAGHPREVCVSCSFTVIEWTPSTAASQSLVLVLLWMLNSVTGACGVGVLDAHSNMREAFMYVYMYRRESFL